MTDQTTAPLARLVTELGASPDPDAIYTAFEQWTEAGGRPLYQHQADAFLAILSGSNAIITTPTGSGKSMIATEAIITTLANRKRVYYTAPIKALVSEKFFSWCDDFGADLVGMVTGDASVNPDAPIICCTAEILANIALREGKKADVDCVVMDEFHFISDRDRGWAWLVPLTELPQTQFLIMSATLGDVTELAQKLTRATGRDTEEISGVERPVPLHYTWSLTPLPDKLDELVATGQAPIYLVHPSQGQATEQAQALLASKLVTTEQRHQIVEAIGDFRFAPGFGTTLRKLLTAGIGIHHAGLLPKYRRLVETLAQQGLLKIICGTDTLGVGINVPIRTVVFTSLAKYDGRRSRILKSREFHQIAGRAGRPGFDPIGYVVAQAPEHQIENERIAQKFANDEKKLKSVRKKKAPEGFINYTEASFEKLINSTPETLQGRLKISHATLINVLQRDENTFVAMRRLIEACASDPTERRMLVHRAIQLGRSLLESGVVVPRETPTPGGRTFDLADELQANFALNQPLSAFALTAIDMLDPESTTYALDVVSVIESTLEDPMQVLVQQQFKARGQAVAEMKEDGYDYQDRKAAADEITWPQPMAEELNAVLASFADTHPWLREQPLRPKSVVRDMYERAMTFGQYVAYYKVQRSEGLLLRYLSDAWRALRQTVPVEDRTEELGALIEWLGEVVTMTDSSLVDEWEAMANPERDPDEVRAEREAAPRPITGNVRAFKVLLRNAMFLRVRLAADDDVDGLAELDHNDPDRSWTADDWDDALGAYWDEYDDLDDGPDARSPKLFLIDESNPQQWEMRQIINDPDGNHDWQIEASVNLPACDAAGELVVHIKRFGEVGK